VRVGLKGNVLHKEQTRGREQIEYPRGDRRIFRGQPVGKKEEDEAGQNLGGQDREEEQTKVGDEPNVT
jgi:hypothetical protein